MKLGHDLCCHVASTFDSSPLSCNKEAEHHATNRFCLVDEFDAALQLAREFGRTQPETGPYVLLEVWADRLPEVGEAGPR